MRPKLAAWSAVLCVLTLSLTGCWDQRSLTERSTVLALSAAPHSGGAIDWTFYFPNPAVTVSSLNQISPHNQFFHFSVLASTLAAARHGVQGRLANHLYMGQLQVLVLSNKLSTDAVARLIEAYNRDGMFPKSAYVLAISNPSAAFPVSLQQPLPQVFFSRYFDCHTCQPLYLGQRIWHFWDELMTPGASPTVPLSSSRLIVDRLLVYPYHGSPAVFGPDATEGWALLTNHVVDEAVTLHTPSGTVGLEHVKSRAATTFAYAKGVLEVRVRIRANAVLNEWPAKWPSSTAHIRAIAAMASLKLAKAADTAIQDADKSRTDPFGWECTYLFRHPQWLQTHRVDTHMPAWPIRARVSATTQIVSQGESE